VTHHTHWHTFQYKGTAYSDPQRRRGEAPSNFPPFVLDEFLTRGKLLETAGTLDEIAAALDWLKQGATTNPPLDQASFPLPNRLAWAEQTLGLERGADLLWGYYTSSQLYVSMAVIACPRPRGEGCPIGFLSR
jgi:hypothetical protein